MHDQSEPTEREQELPEHQQEEQAKQGPDPDDPERTEPQGDEEIHDA